jgi:hypothetical protein
LLRLWGTTWPRLCTPAACTSQVLVCLVGALLLGAPTR